MGKNPKTGEQFSTSSWRSLSLTPRQMGAKSPVETLGSKQYSELINGMYHYFKAYVTHSMDIFSPAETAEELKGVNAKGLQEYEEKAARIADQMMVSFAQNVNPDEVMTFPLDSFIDSSIRTVYDKAGDIFTNPVLSSSELKTMIDANTQNLATQFRQQRRTIEQEINARGLSGPAAMEARERAEQAIAEGRNALATQTMANEFSQKYNRQLAALGTQQTAIGQAQAQTGQLSQRWLEQWRNKLTAEGLRQSGLQIQLGANAQAAGIEQQQYGNLWNQMNYPLNVLNTSVMPFLSTIGQQDINANSGYSTSWGNTQSSGTQWAGSNPWLTTTGGVIGSALIGGGVAI